MADSKTSGTSGRSAKSEGAKPAAKRAAKSSAEAKARAKSKAVKTRSVTAKAAEAPKARKKPGVKPGTKRGKFNKDGSPRQRPGPKPGKVTAKAKSTKTKPTPSRSTKAKTTASKAKAATPSPVAKTAKPAQTKADAISQATSKAPAKAALANAVKTPIKPKPVATTPAPRTVAELHAHVERISAKLERADKRNASAVKSLDTALKALDAKSATDAQARGLVRRITNLKSSLEDMAIDLRLGTRDDLKSVLKADGAARKIEILEHVEARIQAADSEQSRGLARLNQHLADMARAMDSRLGALEAAQTRETKARRAALDVVTGRIDAVESETARAVTDIGERMVALATGLREEIEQVRTGADVSEKISAIAESTQGEFTSFRHDVEGKMDGIRRVALDAARDAEEREHEAARRQAAVIAALEARVEGLEYALSNPVEAVPTPAPAPVPNVAPVVDLDPALMQPAALDTIPVPVPSSVPEPVPAAEPEPVAVRDPNLPDHYPVEWTPPAATTPDPTVPQPMDASLATPMMASAAAAQSGFLPMGGFEGDTGFPAPAAPGYDVPQPGPVPHAPMAGAQPMPLPNVQIADADLPHMNPGYAETGQRPGGFEDAIPSLLARLKGVASKAQSDSGEGKSSGTKARNLRAAGLAVGVAALGTFAVRGALGDGGRLEQAASVQADAQVETGAASQTLASSDPFNDRLAVPETASYETASLEAIAPPGPQPVPTTAPIGDTSALDVPIIAPQSPEGRSLQAAVDAGNPVALYQQGLIDIESGKLDTGIARVRSAADQGLIPAVYRLAKAYEIGQGVPQDLPMAAKLTERAARAGHRIAMHDAGLFYAEGYTNGVPDHATSLQWFERAANHGVLDSQFNLAYLLDRGESIGITPDPVRAYAWYAIASANGDQQASENMVRLKARLSPEQLAQAEARIAAFTPKPIDEAVNGIFRGLPWASPVRAAGLDRESVRRTQALLNQLGFDTGTPDGLAGPRTREAIVEYQRLRSLAETGQPSVELLRALETDAQS